MQRFFQSRDQLVGGLGRHQTCHVLHMHERNAHLFLLQGVLYELLGGVEGADVVLNGALDLFAGFFHCPEGGLTVAQILKGVKNQEDVDAGFSSLLHKLFYNIIGVSPVSYQILGS